MDKKENPAWREIPVKTFIEALRSFEFWRQRVHLDGVNDNAGAIHSGERMAELLSLKIVYPGLTHIDLLRFHEYAWFSKSAKTAFNNDHRANIEIEHVFPKRVYTVELLSLISKGATSEEITAWIADNFKLALLTPDERLEVDKLDRTVNRLDRLLIIRMCEEPDRTM